MTEDKKRTGDKDSQKSGIRPAQVGAAALAAVTAAFLCSTLGVYGTVLGAGLLSLVTTLGSELLMRWLDKTKVAAQAISDGRVRRPGGQPPAPDGARDTETNRDADTGTDTTALLPLPAYARPGRSVRQGRAPDSAQPDERSERRVWWKRRGPLIIGTSAIAFVIGMLVVTGYEGVTGNALSGQGGTTVSSIVGGGSGRDDGGEWRDQRPGQDAPEDERGTDQPNEQEQRSDTEATSPADRQPVPGDREESGEPAPTGQTKAPEPTRPGDDARIPEPPTDGPEPTRAPGERTQMESAVPTR